MSATLPEQIEICSRVQYGQACGGVIWNPPQGKRSCWQCGTSEPGVVYVLPSTERDRAARVVDASFERWDKAVGKSGHSQSISRRDLVFYREVIVADLRNEEIQ